MEPAKKEDIRVLLVEDNPGDRDLMGEHLDQAGGFRHESAATLGEALSKLSTKAFDVVLLDLGLPDSQGLDALRRVHHGAPDVPVIVVTGLGDEAVAVEALRCGAQDYLVKGGLGAELLGRSLRYAVERHRLLSELALERERREKERDEQSFRGLSASPAVTAWLYGARPLSEAAPEIFSELADIYLRLVRASLESQVKRIRHDISPEISALADRLGEMMAGPRDVIEVHKEALQRALQEEPSLRAKALAEEARFLVLQVMGYLAAFYRRYCIGGFLRNNKGEKE